MAALPSQASYTPRRTPPVTQLATWLLTLAAIIYAFLCGLHTLQDFDLGWQLATGRWVVEHHRVFSTDVFSYTAAGQPWIYPALSSVIFYLTFLAGGYAALSYLGAITAAATVAFTLGKRSFVTCTLALLAAPLIANRTQPRAEMFTPLLFAAFLWLLWRRHRAQRAPLWLLPVLMIVWVNLHPGFIAGLALCVAYVLLEALDLPFSSKRHAAFARLRHSWRWLVLTPAATIFNPWGVHIYSSLMQQQRMQAMHNAWIVEWESLRPSWISLHQALDWRDPQSSFWWLMLFALAGIAAAVWRKHLGAALILAASGFLAMQHVRLQALFACVVVIVAGSLLEEMVSVFPRHAFVRGMHLQTASALLLTVALLALIGLRSADLISNRYYLRSNQRAVFGAGMSWWFPERAVNFLEREHLPADIFNGYSLGGYLSWRLFPAYRNYIDSRALPFGPELFFRAYDLNTESPDSAAWSREAEARGINTIIVPLSRSQGMDQFPHLHDFCRSQTWRPVYLDEVSAVFVRVTPQTASLLERVQIDCDKIAFTPPVSETAKRRAQTDLFNFSANAGGVLYSLERYPEALAHLDRAQYIAQDNAGVHLLRALVLQQVGRAHESEAEFRASLSLDPTDEAWFDFGLFYMAQKRFAEAAEIFRRSAESSSRPHEMWMMLGQAYVQSRQPQPALEAFDKAVDASPFHGDETLGASFNSLIAAGRANAWYQLGDLSQAVSFQEEAVRLAPEDRALWQGLADVYEVQGRTTKAAEARSHAAGQ